jgi:hypothetical protein
MATIKELIDGVMEAIEALPFRGDRSGADRELSLAITHLEDAQMRATRGLAKAADKFNPGDVQKD